VSIVDRWNTEKLVVTVFDRSVEQLVSIVDRWNTEKLVAKVFHSEKLRVKALQYEQ